MDRLCKLGATLDVHCTYPEQFGSLFGTVDSLKRDMLNYTAEHSAVSISPLILATVQGDFSTVQYLIKSGASINFADSRGRTPLMAAAAEVTLCVLFVFEKIFFVSLLHAEEFIVTTGVPLLF